MSTPIETQEQQLVEYLIAEVANGISGRDGDEIVDASPSRVLFAGVLQPARRLDLVNPADTIPPAIRH